MEERKPFQNLSGKENPQFLYDGKRIFLEMREKYPNNTNEDLDNILNGLCAALICLIFSSVDKDNHKYLIQLVHKILSKNLD